MHLIWDDTKLDDIDDDIMEEACVENEYNLRSKGVPKMNYFPSTLKTRSLLGKILDYLHQPFNINRGT